MAFGDLTTLADVKAWLQTGQAAFPATDDALLTRLVTAASQYIQTWLNRQIASADYLEMRDGTGGHRLQFACFPVTAVLSLTIDGQAVPAAASVNAAGYRFSSDAAFGSRLQVQPRGPERCYRVYGRVFDDSARSRTGMHRARRAALPGAHSHRRNLKISGRRRDRRVCAKGYERCDQNAAATISSGCADRRDPTSTGGKRRRCRDNIRRPVITARLVGDDAVLAWLRATPDAGRFGARSCDHHAGDRSSAQDPGG